MGIIEILLIGLGLSMDAVAVSMTDGMVRPRAQPQQNLSYPGFFWLLSGPPAATWLLCRQPLFGISGRLCRDRGIIDSGRYRRQNDL